MNRSLKSVFDALLHASAGAVIFSALLSSSADAQTQSGPLTIAKQGWFFVGGKIDPKLPGSPFVDQMYVEYQVPQNQTHPFPVVMIHGGGQTGTNFTGTPDGREGWAQYFLRRGYTVYVVDQVARGRSAEWSQANGPVTAANLERLEERFVAPERFKLWPQAHLHTQWPGNGQPGDPAFDQFYASQVPSLANFTTQQALNTDAGVAMLDRIGPAIVMIHSQSGAFVWPIADRRPGLVKAIIAVEPNGPPVHDLDFKGAPDWFVDNPHTKPFGLGEVSLTYEPQVTEAAPLNVVHEEKAENPDLARCWMQREPARKLVRLANIPLLIVTSEASYHASYDHCTARYLTQAGVKSTHLRLPDAGIHGNGHMMMLEKNSDAIAKAMVDWLDGALPGGAK